MKQPMIDECPCCDARLSGNVQAMCVSAQRESGGLAFAELYWRCRQCGCEWKHGQFEEKPDAQQTTGRAQADKAL